MARHPGGIPAAAVAEAHRILGCLAVAQAAHEGKAVDLSQGFQEIGELLNIVGDHACTIGIFAK